MKRDRERNEEACCAPIIRNHREVVCLRRAGHDGPHEAILRYAAKADGVKHCCRAPIDGDHTADCWTRDGWF